MFFRRWSSTLRNLAIIAHVDHGKTSLVDQLLKQSGAILRKERVMDSHALEQERGITILSKATAIDYKGHRINIVDTPGHADFGGEVERVLSMVDGVCLVVCATEGPMTQTKFVLSKALARKIKPLVVMNKIDRPTARPEEVENDVLELFIQLEASDEQLDYPLIYASAKEGWASLDKTPGTDMQILLDQLIQHVPSPQVQSQGPFSMLVTQIDQDPYVGKLYLGKVQSGKVKVGDSIQSLDTNGKSVVQGKCTKILRKKGLEQESIIEATAGDIVSIAGLEGAHVNHTLCAMSVKEPLDFVPVDPPTISMMIYVNDSPLGGKKGSQLTSQMIRDRLRKELETNVSLQVIEHNDSFEVKGRGELQMGVLIETMRREGFELSVSAPQVLYQKKDALSEPMEEATLDVDHEHAGVVIEKLTKRKGIMKSYTDVGDRARLVFTIPTRGLLGYPSEFKHDTHGQGILNHIFIGYEPFKGPIEQMRKGALVSTAAGEATAYALSAIEPRGTLFIRPGDQVYPGMIIGEHSRETDLDVNPVKAKQLTNFRAAGKEDAIRLTPVEPLFLERLISYIQGALFNVDDEMIEITPTCLRMRKKVLDANQRRQLARRNKN